MLQPGRDSEFCVWREHIEKNLISADQEVAFKILDLLSKEKDGETLETILAIFPQTERASSRKQVKQALGILLNDGLFRLVESRYQFQSGLVRRYWKEYEAE